MSQDVQWYRYLNDLSYVTPKNAWFTTLDDLADRAGHAAAADAATSAATSAGSPRCP